MFYTTEEAAIVCGFLNYIWIGPAWMSLCGDATRHSNSAATETLQPEDYRWAEKVLHFLKPCWWQLQRIIEPWKMRFENTPLAQR